MEDDRPDIEYELMKDDYDRQVDLRDEIESTDHIQPNDLDTLIESRFIPAQLRKWVVELKDFNRHAMLMPETYIDHFTRMADQIEADNQRLQYHLKTIVGKAVGSVVMHFNKEDDRCCEHCLVPMRDHLPVDALCAANNELSKELGRIFGINGQLQLELHDANTRLEYSQALSKALLEDAGVIEDPTAQVELSQARMPKGSRDS